VIELPGKTPRSPVIVVGPVFVTVEPAKTAKLAEVPMVSAHTGPTESDNTNTVKIGTADLMNFIPGLLGDVRMLNAVRKRICSIVHIHL
jgi:hypothetical protein